MQFPTLNPEHFHKIREGVYVKELDRFSGSIPIYRYMLYDSLRSIIRDGEFHVRTKDSFSDKCESGKSLMQAIRHLSIAGKKLSKAQQLERRKEDKMLELSGHWFTSCFTTTCDNIFFWKVYAPNGVMIQTTFDKIIDSLNIDGFNIFAGMMEYNTYLGANLNQCVFRKLPSYCSEKEFRIYFLPQIDYKVKWGSNPAKDSIAFKCDWKHLVDKISMSPFLNHCECIKRHQELKSLGVGIDMFLWSDISETINI